MNSRTSSPSSCRRITRARPACALGRPPAQEPAQVRRDPGHDRAARVPGQRRPRPRTEDRLPLPAVAGVLLGAGVHFDRGSVRLLGRLTPGDEAVLLQNDAARLRAVLDRLRHLARQGEPGAAVRDPDRLVSVDRLDVPSAVHGVGQSQDGVGVCVVDVCVRHEAVQESLDRGAGRSRLHQAMDEVGDHLLVGHRAALHERLEVVQPDPGEMLRFDRLEVRAAPLDPHHAHAAAAEVDLVMLDRGVAAAPDHEVGIATDQAGTVDEQVEVLESPGLVVAPQILHDARIIPNVARRVLRPRALGRTRAGSIGGHVR